ncbi:hypothetical protein [Eilatimonas milleporae]|uniref:Uncharacterized protein n=1 Tax=Eilatimonas milleporae TaxID=911205 RepID=A0A3M0CPF8_9PROT|nr:hypothetical protein [Eilatimonas milleporae]RMB08656.1 hypothetical protein BXY39_1291 [Eilatimonas milleporae]
MSVSRLLAASILATGLTIGPNATAQDTYCQGYGSIGKESANFILSLTMKELLVIMHGDSKEFAKDTLTNLPKVLPPEAMEVWEDSLNTNSGAVIGNAFKDAINLLLAGKAKSAEEVYSMMTWQCVSFGKERFIEMVLEKMKNK